MAEFTNLSYCTNLIQIEYLDTATKTYKVMPRDSLGSLNGFLKNFTSTESISGGSKTVKLRLRNKGLPEGTSFLMLKFDFSDSFNYNPETGVGYESLTDDSVYDSVSTRIKIGPPNQDTYQTSYAITSDRHANADDSIIGIVLSSNQKINTNNDVSSRIAVFPYMPKLDEYIPMELTVTVHASNIEHLSQKRLSIGVPENFVEFNDSTAKLQSKLYTNSTFSAYVTDENYKTFYPKYLGYYFNNDLFTKSGNEVSFPMYVHAMQFYANNNVRYGTDEFSIGKHIYELYYDVGTGANLPSTIAVDITKPYVRQDNLTYSGHADARPLTQIMMELLGFSKHVYQMFRAHQQEDVTSGFLETRIDHLEGCLASLYANIATPLDSSNYTTYSGAALTQTQEFFFNIFVRSLYQFVDWMRNVAFDDTTNVNYAKYKDLYTHLNCVECYDGAYSFPLIQSLTVEDLMANPKYVALSLTLLDLYNYVADTYDTTVTYSNKFIRLRNHFYSIAAFLSENMYRADVFDPLALSDGAELNVSVEDLSYITLFMALSDQAMEEDGSFSKQPWHTALKHFRLKAVNSDSISFLTNDEYANVDLTDQGTYTTEQFLQILADIDIIPMMLYTIVDSFYSKQTSTTLSFKINATNY